MTPPPKEGTEVFQACPFCGDWASILIVDTEKDEALCSGCKTKTSFSVWNRRPLEAALLARIEKLQKGLKEIPFLAYGEAREAGCDSAGAWDSFVAQASRHIEDALKP